MGHEHLFTEEGGKESIQGKPVYFVPGSRRGPITANNVFSAVDTIKAYGTPNKFIVVPIPAVPVSKYFINLTNGLSERDQNSIQSSFCELITGEESASVDFTKPADEVETKPAVFNKFIHSLGYLNFSLNHNTTRAQMSLADSFAEFDQHVLDLHFKRNSIETKVVSVPPSTSGNEIKYNLYAGKKIDQDAFDLVFPKELRNRIVKRFETYILNTLLTEYAEGSLTLIEAGNKLNKMICSAMENRDYSAIKKDLGMDNKEPIKRSDPNAFFNRLLTEKGIQKEDIWDIFTVYEPTEITSRCVDEILKSNISPINYHKRLDEAVKPKKFVGELFKHNGHRRYFTGENVLAYIIERARIDNCTLVMQSFEDRTRTLDNAIRKSNISIDQFSAVYAKPENSYPMRDQSVLLLN